MKARLLSKDTTTVATCLWGSVSSSGGALIGLIAGNVARGFGFGLIGSAAYIVARKGKEVNLPDGTGMLVSIDDAVTLPGTVTPAPATPAPAPPAGQ